jgi:hypothetical protein
MLDLAKRIHQAPDRGVRGEDGDPGRRAGLLALPPLDLTRLLPGGEGPPGLHPLIDRVGGGRPGPGEPEDADVGEQLVPVDGRLGQLGARIGPLVKLLHDPGQLELPSRLRRRVGTLAAAVVSLPVSDAPVDADTLTAIAAACRDHERLRFDYRTHDGAGMVRVTEPHRLVNSGRRWYLLAWDLDKRDWRTFRVDRIGLRLPAGPRFAPREMPDDEVTDRLSRGLATATWRYRARVTVHAPAADIAGRLPAAITVKPVDQDTCVIDVGSDTPYMLALNLGMLDADFQIDESAAPELAEHLRALSARYARALG